MDRRDFLRLRMEARRRVAELSCAQLYVRFCDSQAAANRPEQPTDSNYWEGEPPSELDLPTTRQLFDALDRALQAVDVVRLLDSDWLAKDDFRREMETVLSTFRSRGGRVEYAAAVSTNGVD